MGVNTGTIIRIIVAVCSICIFKSYARPNHAGAQIVTYGSPCTATLRHPYQIEGPYEPEVEEKIPIALNFKVVSDKFTQPRLARYPIAIEVPHTAESKPKKLEDTLRGKTYAYNVYVPPSETSAFIQSYNYAVDVPLTAHEKKGYKAKQVPRLKGLKPRIDKILVPACERPSPRCHCSDT